MIPLSVMQEVIRKQRTTLPELGLPRTATLPLQKNFATVVTGVRRCGKSTLLLQQVSARKPFHYLRFEDALLTSFKPEDFQTLQDAFEDTTKNCSTYLLDEVQNIPSWEIYVRSLLDLGKTVFVTGSNATLLSKELGTRLTGRHLDYTLYPFSFEEFSRFTGKNDIQSYVDAGGFPDYLKTKDTQVLKTLVEDILYRDIIARYSLRDASLLKQVLLYLFSAVGSKVTFQKIAKILQAKSVTTISTYIEYLTNSYLFFVVPMFEYSRRKQLINPKKIYCIDTALAKVFSATKNNLSHYLENVVYLQLRRKSYEACYFQREQECDFIATRGQEQLAIQVTAELNENREREVSGLVEAMNVLKIDKGLIIAISGEDTIRVGNKTIKVVPINKWLLH